MDAELISRLADLGPWGIAAALLVFLRKEIGAVLSAPKGDRAVEQLLIGMNEQFIANMKLFVETNDKLEAVRLVLADLLAVARDIHTEQVRK
jgi:hypothetical protein